MKTLDLLGDVRVPRIYCLCCLSQVNHLSKRHPEMRIDDVPELTLPIIKPNRDYFCQYCDKVCCTLQLALWEKEVWQTIKLCLF